MTSEEQIQKIEEIHKEYMEKIELLYKERNQILSDYIKELETKKIAALRRELGLPDSI